MSIRLLCACALVAGLLSSCAGGRPPTGGTLVSAFAAAPAREAVDKFDAEQPVALTPAAWGRINDPSALAGRVLEVSSLADIALEDREVVLTFDDGPVPKKTQKILATLDEYGVKATFLMVGEMARAHPDIAQLVVRHGHTIGSHTYRHPNLRTLSFEAALAEIDKGQKAVRLATHVEPGFFRFPYLADTVSLRRAAAREDLVVLDVQIDSKDYFRVSPAEVATRTMTALRAQRKGIILLHDIHNRTVDMLPALLTQLKAEGYKVVSLQRKKPSLLVAALD